MQKEKIRNVPSIEELRESGFKVRVYHCRVFIPTLRLNLGNDMLRSKREMSKKHDSPYYDISCKGGYTRIDVTTLTGQDYSAKFNTPKGHNFNRKRGIRVCLGKILKQMRG